MTLLTRLLPSVLLAPVLLAPIGCHWEGEAQSPGTEWEYTQPPAPQPEAVAPAPQPEAQPVGIDPNEADDEDATALVTFKTALDPYGTWVDDPTYGTVWTPAPTSVGSDFSPYLTSGHWSYTSEGYYWSSDYAWGWAPFHYGRWVWTDGYGWAWIPGARYAPAWVDWRYGNGYMGWGPRHPHYCFRNGGVVYIGLGVTPYVFVSSGNFFHPHPHTVVVGPAYHPSLVASTTGYTPPPRPLTGAHPFVGPDPKVSGIPTDHVAKATIASPTAGKPNTVAWVPHPVSKIAPAKPGGVAVPGPTYGKPGVASPGPSPGLKPMPPVYTTPPPTYGPKPYNPPTYGPKPYNPPTYGPAPKPYNPPTYAPAPKPYQPPPTYAPKPYSPPPTYSPAPKPYNPPTYAPKPSSPPTYAPKPSYKPSAPSGGKKK